MDIIKLISDQYERKARLFPALLALAAPMVVLAVIFPAIMNQFTTLSAIVMTFGVFTFLCSIGRERGKRIESILFDSWGGVPTTLLLLYKSTTLDLVSFQRYRNILEQRISGLKFFDKDHENIDPEGAADVCRSAIRWMREATRDTELFPIVFSENIQYGFKRNLYGIKPAAIFLCFISFAVLEFLNFVSPGRTLSGDKLVIIESILIAISLVWILVVNKNFVKTSAFAYADALLLSCDSQHLKKP